MDTGIRQLAESPGPSANGAPFESGQARYVHAPITEHNVHQHIAENPAAHEAHLGLSDDPDRASAAQARYEAAMRARSQGQHQVSHDAMDDYAKFAGVQDPVKESDDGGDGSMPSLW